MPRMRSQRKRRDMCSLDVALAYKNKAVVYCFMDKYAVSYRASESLFHETKKLIWLMARALHLGVPTPYITDELLVLDEMWHNFVLFTKDYREYCDRCHGTYIDHLPGTRIERDQEIRVQRADPEAYHAKWVAELREQLSFIYDELGEKTVLKWYTTLPKRYSREQLEQLRRRQADRELRIRKTIISR
jgi:hypothetical protein